MKNKPNKKETLSSEEALLIAKICHEANKAYCESIGDSTQNHWEDCSFSQKASVLKGIMNIAENPSTTPEESHEGWKKHKIEEGWTYDHIKDEEKRTHPCIVPYSDLPKEQRVKDYLFINIAKGSLSAIFDQQ